MDFSLFPFLFVCCPPVGRGVRRQLFLFVGAKNSVEGAEGSTESVEGCAEGAEGSIHGFVQYSTTFPIAVASSGSYDSFPVMIFRSHGVEVLNTTKSFPSNGSIGINCGSLPMAKPLTARQWNTSQSSEATDFDCGAMLISKSDAESDTELSKRSDTRN